MSWLLPALLVASASASTGTPFDLPVSVAEVSPPAADGAAEEELGFAVDDPARRLSVTLNTVYALEGVADGQLQLRLGDRFAAVGHGTYARFPSEGKGTSTAVFRGGGVGGQWHVRDFERGWFVGADLETFEVGLEDGALLELLDMLGLEVDLTVRFVQFTPRVGWKITGKQGLTASADVGVGPRTIHVGPEKARSVALTGGVHLGWSF